jgi:hypothetical protein
VTTPDYKVIEPQVVEKKVVEAPPKKDYGPPQKRVRNANGDFIVTKIEIPDLVVPVPVDDEKASDEESEEESEEEAAPVEEKKDEVKGKFD